MMKSLIFSVLFVLTSANVLAYGAGGCSCYGHPGAVTAPHGGMIEHIKNHQFVEVLADRQKITIYLLDHDLETLPTDTVAMTGKVRLPQQEKTPVSVNLEPHYGCFIADINLNEHAHRYILDLTIKSNQGVEKVRFRVEPNA